MIFVDIYARPPISLPVESLEDNVGNFNKVLFSVMFCTIPVACLIRILYFNSYTRRIIAFTKSGDLGFTDSCCPWALKYIQLSHKKGGGSLIIESMGNIDLMGFCNIKGFLLISFHCWVEIFTYLTQSLCVLLLSHSPKQYYRASAIVGIFRISTLHIPELLDWLCNITGVFGCIALPNMVLSIIRGGKGDLACKAAPKLATVTFLLWNACQVATELALVISNARSYIPHTVFDYRYRRYGGRFSLIGLLFSCAIAGGMRLIPVGVLFRLRVTMRHWNRVPGFTHATFGVVAEISMRIILMASHIYKSILASRIRTPDLSKTFLLYKICPTVKIFELFELWCFMVILVNHVMLLVWNIGCRGRWLG